MLKCLIKPGDIALDVGAHEGYVALWLSKLGGGELFAVEPNPENLIFLRSNIKLNPEANIKVIEKAVSDEKGRMHFYCSPDAGANGSLIPFSYFSENRIEVEVDTLDSLFGNLQRLDFLKVDTEGNELKVLMGARQLLERCRPQICFEVSLTFWAHLEQSVDALFKFLQDLNYELFVLKGTQLQPYQWLDERIVNMFALHTSRIKELTSCGIITNGGR
jgi:FkbM family methyltransferase